MSKKPTLYIHTKKLDTKSIAEDQYSEIAQYSITPKTFKARLLFGDDHMDSNTPIVIESTTSENVSSLSSTTGLSSVLSISNQESSFNTLEAKLKFNNNLEKALKASSTTNNSLPSNNSTTSSSNDPSNSTTSLPSDSSSITITSFSTNNNPISNSVSDPSSSGSNTSSSSSASSTSNSSSSSSSSSSSDSVSGVFSSLTLTDTTSVSGLDLSSNLDTSGSSAVYDTKDIKHESNQYEPINDILSRGITLSDNSSAYKPYLYVDGYEFSDNQVLRFGINTRHPKLVPIPDLGGIGHTLLGSRIDLATTVPITQSNNSGSSSGKKVKSSHNNLREKTEPAGVDTPSITSTHNSQIPDIKHHPLETFLLQQATSYLMNQDSRKTVLIDMFARNEQDSWKMKGMKKGIFETHTVVLYKNPPLDSGTHEVIIIDPSNFKFSSHLRTASEMLKRDIAEFEGFIAIHKPTQIYKSMSDNTGSNHNQYRDCIDISVKLAFKLNKTAAGYAINLQKFNGLDAIKMLSNDLALNTNLFSFIKDAFKISPFRIQQKSDLVTVGKFNDGLLKIKLVLDLVKTKKDTGLNLKDLSSNLTKMCLSLDREDSNEILLTLEKFYQEIGISPDKVKNLSTENLKGQCKSLSDNRKTLAQREKELYQNYKNYMEAFKENPTLSPEEIREVTLSGYDHHEELS